MREQLAEIVELNQERGFPVVEVVDEVTEYPFFETWETMDEGWNHVEIRGKWSEDQEGLKENIVARCRTMDDPKGFIW